jgi:hypothetical protein
VDGVGAFAIAADHGRLYVSTTHVPSEHLIPVDTAWVYFTVADPSAGPVAFRNPAPFPAVTELGEY